MSIIYINPFQFAAAPSPGGFLLDDYPNAAAAYSLRQLRTGVTSVIRVRRSSDNAEADFTATEVSDGTLAAWVGAGNDGFVRTWYDQSGKSQHLNQASTTAQPQIVSSGSVITDSGKPAIQTDGTSDFMQSPNGAIGSVTSFYITAVASITASDTRAFLGASNNSYSGANHWILIRRIGATTNFRHNRANVSTELSLTYAGAKSLFQFSRAGTSLSAWINTATSTATIPADSVDLTAEVDFGAIDVNGSILQRSPGLTQELIVYATNQSSNRAAIESNINAHYSIF